MNFTLLQPWLLQLYYVLTLVVSLCLMSLDNHYNKEEINNACFSKTKDTVDEALPATNGFACDCVHCTLFSVHCQIKLMG